MVTLSTISQNRYRVIYLMAGFALSVFVSWLLLAPNSKPSRDADYRFMHCRTCKTERAYDHRFSEMKCLKCGPKKDGAFVPTVASIGGGGGGSPWKWFGVVVALEFILFLGVLVYLVKPRSLEVEKKFLYCNCPKCKWRLRFRETSAGKDGQCPRCKRIFKFPSAERADTREFPVPKNEESEVWPQS